MTTFNVIFSKWTSVHWLIKALLLDNGRSDPTNLDLTVRILNISPTERQMKCHNAHVSLPFQKRISQDGEGISG